MPHDFHRGRHTGLLVPLFSVPSRVSWGVGEIPDLVDLARWIRNAGCSFVQLLPLNEMAHGQNSPYSAMSAMAIDPVFISPARSVEVQKAGGSALLSDDERQALGRSRRAPAIDYAMVRRLKSRAFRAAFDVFEREEWSRDTARAQAFRAFIDRERWWLEEYTLFRTLHAHEQERSWRDWPAPLRDREPSALEAARSAHAHDILYYGYLQWLAAEQWRDARASCGIGVFGDFPFMVSGDSADVWSRQADFRLDASVGAPPDAFSETGQDWGLPVYRWSDIESGGYEWLAARVRRSADLFDGYRVDHLVGFFRTYVREQDGRAGFVPAVESEQIAQGERLLRLFRSTGARVIAEDLGVIPNFVRATLAGMEIAGYKVLRWEREWDEPGRPFRDPRAYPACAVATTGTHDTETLAEWWDAAPIDERRALAAVASLRDTSLDPDAPFSGRARDTILAALIASSADLVLLPIQDVFGWRDRI
ncbi:MAG: 4-alpha-glucanotransferase, partial [Vicinamibacterales bacterium]